MGLAGAVSVGVRASPALYQWLMVITDGNGTSEFDVINSTNSSQYY